MTFFEKKVNLDESYQNALHWVIKNTIANKGVIVSSRQRIPYAEVTGYLIPTLFEAGEYDLARQYAEYLNSVQNPNGSFTGPDGHEYIFDSGQALRGLVCAASRWEKFIPNAQRCADYLVSSMKDNGCLPAIYDYEIPSAIQVYVLPALVQAAKLLNEPRYFMASQKGLEFYKRAPEVLFKGHLTHFLAYIIDGFIEMGEGGFVLQTVKDIFSKQNKEGGIPAHPEVNWVCSVGVAQLAIIACKLQMKEEMDKSISYLARKQNPGGGFWGSYGHFAKYFPQEEISWANKFFLDLLYISKGTGS